MRLNNHLAVTLSVCLAISGCNDTPKEETRSAPTLSAPETPANLETRKTDAELERVNLLASRLHQQALDAGKQLLAAINQLHDQPSREHLITARSRWEEAHQAIQPLWLLYQLNNARILLESPQPDTGYTLASQLDATPQLSGYLDTVPGYPTSGIIHASGLELSPALLAEKHQFSDPLFLTYGLHPLEFMLWSETGLTADILQPEPPNAARQQPAEEAQAPLSDPNLLQRRLQLTRLIASQYPQQLSLLYSKWMELQLSEQLVAHPDKTDDSNAQTKIQVKADQYPALETNMRYLDAQILSPLMPIDDEPGWVYQEHMMYTHNAQPFWQGRINGLTAGLTLLNLKHIDLQELTQELADCVKGLDPVATGNSGDVHHCKTLALGLREKLIILFAESHQ